tara:strand:- start:2217 stop:3089 length:873 start_codon:yes stop_codon:yes gene_type:complete
MEIINQELTKFSTIRTQSFAEYYCKPKSISDLEKAISFSKINNLPIVVLGNGSNILFSKSSYNDVLFLKLTDNWNSFIINNDCTEVKIGASYSLKLAGRELIKIGCSDYIFFNLIPACIGGAVTQNAGIGPGEEIKDVCVRINCFDILKGIIVNLENEECLFEYRNSIIKKKPNRYIVLSATFSIINKVKDIKNLEAETKARISEKISREPSGYSFGSTFMNSSIPAWKCIKNIRSKLKPNCGAFFSEKHNNWIINKNASGEDIIDLIKDTQKLVKEELNIDLINEVRII